MTTDRLLNRKTTKVETGHEFKIKEKVYTRQYSELYATRLNQLKDRLSTWPDIDQIRIVNVSSKVSSIFGTIYCDMPEKPNVLNDITRQQWVLPPAPKEKYLSEQDSILLEDESGRVKLTGSILKDHILTSGMVVGVVGNESKDGSFEIIDICYPNYGPEIPLSLKDDTDCWVALVSGLNIDSSGSYDFKLHMLSEYLVGELGESQDFSCNIVRVIIAGNSIAPLNQKQIDDLTIRDDFGCETTRYDSTPVETLDEWLTEICTSIDVDIMPGQTDPATHLMPQQAMHASMFTNSCHYSTFQSVLFVVNNVLGTSGQNIENMYKYTKTDSRMDIAKQTLKCAHLAPTCPDTLWCYPFTDRDPFIIEQLPKVYFVGNQPQYESELVLIGEHHVRIVMLPVFCETGTLCLVNTRTLETKTVEFDISKIE
ncbi:DNA polymerase alpha/epsilon subunit B-domain-containing protein [Globomyces pollinis-pini]|nr:DNA polymerase alpha/epsilon subunit B-domain-containing protein [Globomyces pollinis-pini]